MRASQVLDLQGDLLWRLTDRRAFRELLIHSVEAAAMGAGETSPEYRKQYATRSVDLLESHVKHGYAYRVTPDMVTLVEHAAATLDDSDQFDAMLAPTPMGVVRLDKPIPMNDIRGHQMLVHWIVWGPDPGVGGSRRATLLWFFNDNEQPDQVELDNYKDFVNEYGLDAVALARSHLGRWNYDGYIPVLEGQRLGPPLLPIEDLDDYEAARRRHLANLDQAMLPLPDQPADQTNAARIVHALWLMFGQTITTIQNEHVDRPALKRAKRMKLPGRVTVIRLRRAEGHRQEGESHVEWSHRWIVRGFWRWQPYGSRRQAHVHELGKPQVTTERRLMARFCTVPGCDYRVERIYIAPYEKGPADKPLVITDKVYSLER